MPPKRKTSITGKGRKPPSRSMLTATTAGSTGAGGTVVAKENSIVTDATDGEMGHHDDDGADGGGDDDNDDEEKVYANSKDDNDVKSSDESSGDDNSVENMKISEIAKRQKLDNGDAKSDSFIDKGYGKKETLNGDKRGVEHRDDDNKMNMENKDDDSIGKMEENQFRLDSDDDIIESDFENADFSTPRGIQIKMKSSTFEIVETKGFDVDSEDGEMSDDEDGDGNSPHEESTDKDTGMEDQNEKAEDGSKDNHKMEVNKTEDPSPTDLSEGKTTNDNNQNNTKDSNEYTQLDNPSSSPNSNSNQRKKKSLLHATIRIITKKNRGLTGKVTEIKRGAWHVIDNPMVDVAVQPNQFRVVRYADGSKGDEDEYGDDSDDNAGSGGKNHDGNMIPNKDGEESGSANKKRKRFQLTDDDSDFSYTSGSSDDDYEDDDENLNDDDSMGEEYEHSNRTSNDHLPPTSHKYLHSPTPTKHPHTPHSNDSKNSTNSMSFMNSGPPNGKHRRYIPPHRLPPTNPNYKPLMGASIRIRSGKYQGMEGRISEKRSGEYCKVDTIDSVVRAEDVEVVRYKEIDTMMGAKVRVRLGEGEFDLNYFVDYVDSDTGDNEDEGAGCGDGCVEVGGSANCSEAGSGKERDCLDRTKNGRFHAERAAKVKGRAGENNTEKDNQDAKPLLSQEASDEEDCNDHNDHNDGINAASTTVEGKVIRVFSGNWYITDNPNIRRAFEPHEFKVLCYADGTRVKRRKVKSSDAKRVRCGGDEDDDDSDGRDDDAASANSGGDCEEDIMGKKTMKKTVEVATAAAANGEKNTEDSKESKGKEGSDRDNGGGNDKGSNNKEEKDEKQPGEYGRKNNDKDNDRKDSGNNERGKDTSKSGSEEDNDDEDDEDGDQDHDPNEKSPSSNRIVSKSNPLIGIPVYVFAGTKKGHSGTIIETRDRGWWTLDNLELKVKCNQCRFIDDGLTDFEKVRGFYKKKGLLKRMPGIVKSGEEKDGDEEEREDLTEEGGSKSEQGKVDGEDLEMELLDELEGKPVDKTKKEKLKAIKRKISTTDFIGDDKDPCLDTKTIKKQGMSERGSSIKWGEKPVLSLNIPNVPSEANRQKRHQKIMRARRTVPVLDPIILNPTYKYYTSQSASHQQNFGVLEMQLLPSQIRHLPPDAKIEIFNRKTGKVMKGPEAVSLSELPSLLMMHAEYEPIIPPPHVLSGYRPHNSTSNPAATTIRRQGRSGPNIRVSNTVNPQSRVRVSAVEGKDVLVTAGPYRGLSGKIDSCIPGGWYLVSNLFKNDGLALDVVVSSQHLKIIPEKIKWSLPSSTGTKKTGKNSFKNHIHLEAAKLRLSALVEEKEKTERKDPDVMADNAESDNVNAQVKRLEACIDSVSEHVAKLQKSLDDSGNQSSRKAAN